MKTKFSIFTFLLLLGALFVPFSVAADTLYSQQNSATVDTTLVPVVNITHNTPIYKLGTGLQGSLDEVAIRVRIGAQAFGSTRSFNISLYEYNDSAYTATSSLRETYTASGIPENNDVHIRYALGTTTVTSISTGAVLSTNVNTVDLITLDPAKYYAFTLTGDGCGACGGGPANNPAYFFGSSNSLSWPTGEMWNTGSFASTLGDIYFVLSGPFLSNNIDTRTRIVSQDNPLSGSLQASTTVSFEYDYYVGNDVYTTAGFDVRDFATGQQLNTPTEVIWAQGLSSFTETMTLTAGRLYGWRPFLQNSSGQYVYGAWATFDVVSYSGDFDSLDPNATNATSSVMARFFGLNSYFASKFPFAYFYDFKAIWDGISEETSENSFPTFAYQTPTSSPVAFNVVLLSTSTLTEYVGTGTIATVRTAMEVFLWVGFGFMVFYSVKNLLRH